MTVINLEQFGGKAENTFDNTEAFKNAFAHLKAQGGGKLIVKSGVWRTGPIDFVSNTTLYLEENAVISFIPEPELYQPVRTRWEGVECYAMHPCVFGSGVHDAVIGGKGIIDGEGSVWWEMRRQKKNQGCPVTEIEKKLASLNPDYRSQPGGGGGREVQFLRPPLIQFINCANIRIEDVTVRNSPFWTVHPVYCDNFSMYRVSVCNPHDAPNTDGIDIDSCTNVQIIDCSVSVGDDGIALKSGSGPDGIRVNKPCRNVIVRGCTVGDGHGGIVIGSETAAGVDHLLAENCVFDKTDRGIRIKTRRGRGGDIHHLEFRNLTMNENLCPFAMNMYYKCGASPDDPLFSLEKQPVTEQTPRIHDVLISGIHADGCRASAGFIAGLPEAPVENLVIENSVFTTDESSSASPQDSDMFFGIPPVAQKSFRVKFADNPEFSNVAVRGPQVPYLFE
ncbi:MAG: glycoside hydrolase family 28 protein [Bacteroides sp.]|nr:glycoside hydrolase family 28 protein [Prevotella sp.]MCM1408619.1 glycoside hydrolase family 28 protein [Treponema brennaborense]MCM1468893.1 glycoside hydrolase family 28 protein [Bacteroides sp.]